MIARLNTTVHLLRHMGPNWLLFRLGYAFRRRAGVLKRTLPGTSWEAQPLESFLSDRWLGDAERFAESRWASDARFFFQSKDRDESRSRFAEWDADRSGPVAIADALEQGVFPFFEHQPINLGSPPNWHQHPITGYEYLRDRHWTEIGDFSAGDIKLVWEPSRFAWVYPLVRAYWRTGDERYPRVFWKLLGDWQAANPPQRGVNWKCGQEVAIRTMACCFGLYGFAGSAESTPRRIAALAQLTAVSATRIEGNLSYALSQQNNHGITEAVGLWTVGLLFPEFAASSRWRDAGRLAIERQTRDLIDDDGAFSQHSVNYQRVMLDACLWAIRLGQLNGESLSNECIDRVRSAGLFLWQLQDDVTGQLPRYGQNDGALLLSLTNCDSADYRPVIQALSLQNGEQRYEPGPWDEAALWLLGPEALDAPLQVRQRSDWHGAAGGYQVLRAKSGHLVTRSPRYRYRPAHADALHVDIWWRGLNIALDAGTHSYNAAPPWNNPLAGTACHNTVMVDGRDQMDRAGRFLWLPWLRGSRTAFLTSPGGELTYWEGTHDGYRRLPSPVTHRRGVLRIGDEHWLVIDALNSNRSHRYRLHWLLTEVPFFIDESRGAVTLATEHGEYQVNVDCTAPDAAFSLVRADDDSPRGWYAPYYNNRQPALSLAMEATAKRILFVTLLGPESGDVRVNPTGIDATVSGRECHVAFATGREETTRMLSSVQLDGGATDTLTVP